MMNTIKKEEDKNDETEQVIEEEKKDVLEKINN